MRSESGTCCALGRQHRKLQVTEVEAPDLAAVIQRGFPFEQNVVEMVRSYCAPLKRAEVDTVDPRLHALPAGAGRCSSARWAVTFASSAPATRLRRPSSGCWPRRGSRPRGTEEGTYSFICTGDPERFRELGTRFLQMPLGEVELVELP